MTASGRYFITPMPPTPNGNLHIGHAAGTYLHSDAIRRALTAAGHRVTTVLAADVFESGVAVAAFENGLTPEAFADSHERLIARDLDLLDIHVDEWFHPSDEHHRTNLTDLHARFLEMLDASGSAWRSSERIPFAESAPNDAVVGGWLTGHCPSCGNSCTGSICVGCGDYLLPQELENPVSRFGDAQLRWFDVENWFAHPLNPSGILAHYGERNLPDYARRIIAEYIARCGGRIRMSACGTWGLKDTVIADGHVFRNNYYTHSFYCGELYSRQAGSVANPLSVKSDVSVVAVFGLDNSIEGFVTPHVIAQGSRGALKPYDFPVTHGLLHFDGRKCSTSKGHGIWIGELLGSGVVSSDELRYALMSIDLTGSSADFTTHNLFESVNEFRNWASYVLSPALRDSASVNDRCRGVPKEGGAGTRARSVIEAQVKVLTPPHIDVGAATSLLRGWMFDAGQPRDRTWLTVLAVLGEPIAPAMAATVWRTLGRSGQPNVDAMLDDNCMKVREPAEYPRAYNSMPLTARDVAPFVHHYQEVDQ